MSENIITELQAKNLLESGLSISIYKWASDFINDAMKEWIGTTCYACEIGYEITDEENIKNRYKKDSIISIIEHFEEAGKELYKKDSIISIIEHFKEAKEEVYKKNSVKFIMEHFKEAGEEFRYQKEELCSEINPFESPEEFVECWLNHAVERVLCRDPVIIDNWNKLIEITEEIVDEIKKYLI